MFTVFTKRVLLLSMTGVYPITETFPFFLQLLEAIWKTVANPVETFIQSYVEKYEIFFALYHNTNKVMNDFPYL